ncbi:Peptide-N(4)-(N-acetyl-beta-glucosaminyl)asparagine amidase [Bertholletia excelsa]
MQKQSILCHKIPTMGFGKVGDGKYGPVMQFIARISVVDKANLKSICLKAKAPLKPSGLYYEKLGQSFHVAEVRSVANENIVELSDEDDDLCPVECVKEFRTDEELFRILEKAKETDSLVVVDFYRTACGSCKYIEQIFSKLCKGSGDEEAEVIFLKHNVIDEYDEQSEVAERLRIKAVPLFHFYKNGVLLEAFPTRDKERIVSAILKYTS